jgi:glycosyltransferase involved in cell wall biosynthesis
MIEWHRARGTWRQHVARFIALSEFARDLFIRAGLPAERLVVKPNFVAHPRPSSSSTQADRKGALFVGRLSAEKGAATMVAAWRELPGISLNIIGDGPEHAKLMAAAGPNVHFMGFRDRAAVVRAMAEAQALIVPSEWLEPFGMVVAEAMALGTPVIASRIGALASIVADSRNGLHFAPGDAADLARVVRSAFNNAQMLADMGLGARATWEATMAPSRNFERLVEIYREAIAA